MLQPVTRPWLKNYPAGVSPDIDTSQLVSLVQLLDDAFARHAGRDAAVCMGSRLSYAQLDASSAALAAWLQASKLGRGMRVAIMLPNVPPCLVAMAGALRAGCTVVMVNPLYTARELEHQLLDSGAEAIVVLEQCAGTLAEVVGRTPLRHVVVASLGDLLGAWKGPLVDFTVRHVKRMVPRVELTSHDGCAVTRFKDVLHAGARMTWRRPDTRPEDIAFLQYTGGTTGISKGAMLLHRHVAANVLQAQEWFKPVLARVPPGRQVVNVCALPLFHIFALTCCGLFGIHRGMLNLLIPNPRDLPRFVRALQGHRVHLFPGVNTLFNALADHPGFARLDFSELAACTGGGMAVQAATARRWQAITGCPIVEGYGLSETSPIVCVNRPDITEHTGTVGLPLPSTEIAIRDEDGRDVSMGEPGEVCIRGPQVMAGYWKRPDETARAMTPDGYFRSGDIGTLDDGGHLRIVDRKKDMILVSGFNVYPSEVEQVVSAHPGVLECAAIGVPDARTGEAVKLFVVRRDPGLTEKDILAHCTRLLTGYKRPRVVEFRDELPKSNVGKILRRALRDTA